MKFPRMKKGQSSPNPPPGSRLGYTGPESGWRRGFTSIGVEWIIGPAHPGNFLPPLVLLISSLCPLPMVPLRLPNLSFIFFLVLGTVPIMAGQLAVIRGGAPATRGGVPGGQRTSKDRICGVWVKGQKPLWHLAGGHGPARAFHVWWPTLA